MKVLIKKNRLLWTGVISIIMIFMIVGGITLINSSKFYVLKGDNFLSYQNYEKAIASYEKALEIDKENEAAYLGIYESYLNLDNIEMAKKYIAQGLVFLPENNLMMEKWEQFDENEVVSIVGEEEVEEVEDSEIISSSEDLLLIKQDIQNVLDNYLVPSHIDNIPPAFNILENHLPEMSYLLTVALAGRDYSEGTIDYINQKISERFNLNLNLSVEDVRQYSTWTYDIWSEEEQRFLLPERGFPTKTSSEIVNISEKDGFYEVEVMHYGAIWSWDYPTSVLYQGQNKRIIGNSYYEEQKFFYPIDDLETSTYRFQYNENGNLVVVSCELSESYQGIEAFNEEVATEFIYQYFNLAPQSDVVITMLEESPSEYEGIRYYKFDFINDKKLNFEWGARTGQYWISEYGGIYESYEEDKPGYLVIG